MSNKNNKLDCKKCIQYLLDKKVDGATRVAAAESLMLCNTKDSKNALFKCIMDENELDYIREEAAGSLGTLWAESEIDYEKLIQIPVPYIDEVVTDFDLYKIKINKERLGNKIQFFIKRYINRKFMA